MTQEQALSRVLRDFARTMTGSFDMPQALYDLSDSVVEVLGATAAGVAVLDGENLRFLTATSDMAERAEAVQERSQDGPCLESIRLNQPVTIDDIRAGRDRWPQYAPFVEEIGFGAVLGIPLVLGEQRIGSLDVYNAEPRQWSENDVDAAMVLADIGAAFVINASQLAQTQRTADQLQTALDTRVVIEQAKGVLAERVGISTDEAFQRIRATARRQSTKVADICRRIIDTDYVPD